MHPSRTILAFALAAGSLACADKALTPPKAILNPRMSLVVTTLAQQQQAAPTPKWIWVAAAAEIPGGDTSILAMKNVPLTGGTQTITLDVDLAPCIAATAAKGRSGCSIIVGAALRTDTISMSDTAGHDPFIRAFDFRIVGPFDVSAGRAPTIPPIDLSASRFTTFDWQLDGALRLGGGELVTSYAGGNTGRVLTGAVSGTSSPVLFTPTFGSDFSAKTNNQLAPIYPALGIFENGSWRRILATAAPPLPSSGTTNPVGFMDVGALAANDVYIAGTSGLFRYDGTTIARVNNIGDELYAVGTASTANGKFVIATGVSGIAWISNGGTWQKTALPTSARFDGACITGATEAFASSSASGEIYRYNGTSWVSVPAPTGAAKMDLQCTGPGQAFVTAQNAGFYRWNGASWSAIPLTGLGPVRLTRISAVSPTEIFAAGDSVSADRAYYRFDGTAWTEIGRRRHAQSPLRVWADPRGGSAYVLSAFGRLEKISPTSIALLSYQPALRDVAMTSATSAFAVGWNLFLARWDGARWTIDAPPAGTPSVRILQGVWSDGPSNAWAVGGASTILRYNGTSWSVLSDVNKPVATSDNYNAVWGTGSDVWVVGDNTILHCRAGTSCVTENVGGGILYGIWGTSATNVYAVGAGGRILRYNGTGWSAMNSPTAHALARVAGSGPGDIWAVGDSVLIHHDGAQWTNVPMTGDLTWARSRVPSPMQGIFQLGLMVYSPKEAYLGSESGMILRWNGVEWREVTLGNLIKRRVMSLSGAAGCALGVTEGQSDLPAATLWRGVGTNGCLASPMQPPSIWP